MNNKATYWNDIYNRKSETEVSWYQKKPTKSLELIKEFKLPNDAKIIDVGGGDSHLTDVLLDAGFKNINILDISERSLEKLKIRLGEKGKSLNYIASDVTQFNPTEKYDLWHDRATFHFLTNLGDVETYLKIASNSLVAGGFLIISTFSKSGPESCSGLKITQYSQDDLKNLFGKYFQNIKCFEDTHKTPWGSDQNFVYCGFKKG